MLILLAWKNIWRNRKRSLIMVSAITLGLASGIFLMAFYNGMIDQRVRSAINTETSHLQIHHPRFSDDYDVQYFIPRGNEILANVSNSNEVKAATGRLVLQGMIASPAGSAGVFITGIMPPQENKVTGIEQRIAEGRIPGSASLNQILLSESLKKKLKLRTGGKVIISFQDTSGDIVSAAFRISGLYRTANKPYDDSHVFVLCRDIDSLAGLKGQINEIAILLASNTYLEQMQENLKKQYPALKIRNWRQISPEIGLTMSVADQMVYIFMGIILLALAFGIVNTMMMSILERTRELGMLIALGMKRGRVFSMVLLETIGLVAAGCPGGIAIAYFAIWISGRHGISFSQYREVYASFGYESVIYPTLEADQLVTVMLMVIVTSLIAGLFPAWRVLQLNPSESLKK